MVHLSGKTLPIHNWVYALFLVDCDMEGPFAAPPGRMAIHCPA